jgi:hypothetical protein
MATAESNLKLFHTLPPYNPGSALSAFWLFAPLKKHLKGIHFTPDEEVQATTRKWFQKKPEEFYSNGFEKLIHCWWCCIKQEGVYVKN